MTIRNNSYSRKSRERVGREENNNNTWYLNYLMILSNITQLYLNDKFLL